MNYAELLDTWSSPLNRPTEAMIARHKQWLTRRLARRRLGFLLTMTPPAIGLSLTSALLVWRIAQHGPQALGAEWAAGLLLLTTWATFFVFARSQGEHLRRHPRHDHSVSASIRGLLDDNLRAQRRARWLLWSNLLGLPVIALALRQLDIAGKIEPRELLSAAIFFGAVLLLSSLATWLYRSRRLRPEEKHLRELVGAYRE